MFKKALAMILALALSLSLWGCEDNSKTETDNKTSTPQETPENDPEKIAADFIQAMYYGDLDAFFVHIPEFTYDVVIKMENLEVPEGKTKADIAYDYFANNMEQEPEELATDVKLETKISDTMTRETYMASAKKYYVSEGIVSEADLEKIQDVAFVAFNCDVTYKNGETRSLKDFESVIPCVKIDGKWYVDILYLLFKPVRVETKAESLATPVQDT